MLARQKTLANTTIITREKARPQPEQPTRKRPMVLKQHSGTSWRSAHNGPIVWRPHLCCRPPTFPTPGRSRSLPAQQTSRQRRKHLYKAHSFFLDKKGAQPPPSSQVPERKGMSLKFLKMDMPPALGSFVSHKIDFLQL